MKSVKMLGLAALAALMTMAFVGAPAASAESTAFCNVDPGEGPEEVCPAGKLITHLHAETVAEFPAVALTTLGNVACSVLYLADTAESLASPLVLKGTFTYSSCTSGCSIKEENGPSKIELLKLGHEKADAKLEILMNVKCSTGINCNYRANGMKGVFKGALLPFINGEDDFGSAELTKESGFFCPNQAFLDLLIFSLETFYIAK